ncbi:hypothetical protein L207DRAFT_105893 [Hyaloscypha variabilis F]|uniref:Uncharacterized protein n=1 Tax=Hyaloscypha variabilis (strain UAMH 11265 / GT02V1 / F) TaxID=1149755 RepID=A0A2J6RCT4_HYAVF|nr:hypothetical protein L207DRAFT_105893 [Hyaloscypha variabilis F]
MPRPPGWQCKDAKQRARNWDKTPTRTPCHLLSPPSRRTLRDFYVFTLSSTAQLHPGESAIPYIRRRSQPRGSSIGVPQRAAAPPTRLRNSATSARLCPKRPRAVRKSAYVCRHPTGSPARID